MVSCYVYNYEAQEQLKDLLTYTLTIYDQHSATTYLSFYTYHTFQTKVGHLQTNSRMVMLLPIIPGDVTCFLGASSVTAAECQELSTQPPGALLSRLDWQ